MNTGQLILNIEQWTEDLEHFPLYYCYDMLCQSLVPFFNKSFYK